jgi:hypothetical protein
LEILLPSVVKTLIFATAGRGGRKGSQLTRFRECLVNPASQAFNDVIVQQGGKGLLMLQLQSSLSGQLPMGRIPSPDQNNTCPSELAATLDIYI